MNRSPGVGPEFSVQLPGSSSLLRDYFPKGTDLRVHSPQRLLAVESELNRRPRRVIQDCTPTELFESLLTSSHVNCCNDG